MGCTPLTRRWIPIRARSVAHVPQFVEKSQLRGLVEVSHPAVPTEDFELLGRQGPKLGRTDIGVDVARRTHASNDGRYRGLRKAVLQSYFGKAVNWDAEVSAMA